jgi:hypothetical protein
MNSPLRRPAACEPANAVQPRTGAGVSPQAFCIPAAESATRKRRLHRLRFCAVPRVRVTGHDRWRHETLSQRLSPVAAGRCRRRVDREALPKWPAPQVLCTRTTSLDKPTSICICTCTMGQCPQIVRLPTAYTVRRPLYGVHGTVAQARGDGDGDAHRAHVPRTAVKRDLGINDGEWTKFSALRTDHKPRLALAGSFRLAVRGLVQSSRLTPQWLRDVGTYMDCGACAVRDSPLQ